MKNVEIRILGAGGTSDIRGTLDVSSHEDFPLALNFGRADYLNWENFATLGRLASGFTKDFRIPATAANNSFLELIYDTNIRDFKNVKADKDCVILVNTLPVMKGIIRLRNVYEGRHALEYEFTIQEGNFNWITLLREKKLNELQFDNTGATGTLTTGGSYSVPASIANKFIYNQALVEASWDNGFSDGWDFFFPIIHYGSFKEKSTVSIEDTRPALFMRAIIKNAFEGIEHTISSTFFDTTDFKRLYFPFVGNNFLLTDTQRDDKKFRASLDADILINLNNISPKTELITFKDNNEAADFDTGGNWDNSTSLYSANGNISFETSIVFNAIVPAIIDGDGDIIPSVMRVTVNILKDSTVIATAFQEFTAAVINVFTNETIFVSTDGFIFLPEDDVKVELVAVIGPQDDSNPSHTPASTASVLIKSGSFLLNDASKDITRGEEVNFTDVLPDFNQFEIINGLTGLFNLYWKTVPETKKVFVEERDSFYTAFSTAIDWTSKLAVDREIKITFLREHKREMLFKYQEDPKDKYVEKRNEITDDILGSFTHTLPTRFPLGVQEFGTNFYAPTYNINALDVSSRGEGESIYMPRLWKEYKLDFDAPQYTNDFGPRILYYKGNINQKDKLNLNRKWSWHVLGNLVEKVPTSFMGYTDEENGDGTDFSLDYASETKSGNGLVEDFFAKTINIVEAGIKLECWLNFTQKDVNELDLRTPVFFDTPPQIKGYWALNKLIDYQPNESSLTKVELIKLVQEEEVISVVAVPLPVEEPEIAVNKIVPVSLGGGLDKEFEDEPIPTDFTQIEIRGGKDSQVKRGSGGIALGEGTISNRKNQAVIGRFNKVDSNLVFAVGAGISDDERFNGLNADKDGYTSIRGGEIFIEDETNNLILPVLLEDDANSRFIRTYLE